MSTGTVPVLLLWAVLQAKALRSAGSCIPFHLAAPGLQHLQNSAAIQAGRGLSPAADLSHQGLEAFLTLLHQPWKRFPCTHKPPGSIIPAPPSWLCPRGWGPARGGWNGCRGTGTERAGGGCPFPAFLRQPCSLPAAPAQRQACTEIFLAFSFPN